MLYFKNLSILDKHQSYLQKKLKNENFFLVGGCIRDLLLGTDTNPKDIDLAMAGDPQKIYNNLDKTNISHFITEKFGTMTIIPKWKKEKKESTKEKLQYELTPFRKETTYSDKRHPDEIEWSNSLCEDAQRREFTISCIYYFSDWKEKKYKTPQNIETDTIQKNLKQHGFDYILELELWIIQDQKLIEKLFKNWKYQKKHFDTLISKYAKIHNTNEPTNQRNRFLLDPFKWINDLILGKLKSVWEPDKRFQEDALRLIRALRFVNIINKKLSDIHRENTSNYIDFEKETRKSIQKNFALIQYMAKERIKIELDKVFLKWNPFGFIALLDTVNMLKILFPSIYATKHIDQPIRYHPFDTYHHTILVLFEWQKINKNPLVRRALLYHDVGKPDQYYLYKIWLSREELQQTQYLNHRNTSWKIAKKELQWLWFSNKEIEEIVRYIDNHHKPEEILNAKPKNREKKLRRMLSEAGIERMNNLFDVVLWDRMWHYNPIQPPETTEIEELRELTKKIYKKEWQFTPRNLAINWQDIMKKFNINPSPHVGELLNKAFDRVINDITNRNNEKEIMKFLKK